MPRVKPEDLTYAELKVLRAWAKLTEKNGGREVSDYDVAAALKISQPTVLATMRRIERKGYITPREVIPRKLTALGKEWL